MTSQLPQPEASPTDSSTTKVGVQPFANSNLSSTTGVLQKGRLILEQSYLFFTQLAKILGRFWRDSPFKVLCNGLICSFVKRGANLLGGEKNVARAGV